MSGRSHQHIGKAYHQALVPFPVFILALRYLLVSKRTWSRGRVIAIFVHVVLVVHHKRPARRVVVAHESLCRSVIHEVRHSVVVHVDVCLRCVVPEAVELIELISIAIHHVVTI